MNDTYFETVVLRESICGFCRVYKVDMKDRRAECQISSGSEIYYKKEYKFDEIHYLALMKYLEVDRVSEFMAEHESNSNKTDTSIEVIGFTSDNNRRFDCYYDSGRDGYMCPLGGLYNHIVSHFFPNTKHMSYSVYVSEIGEVNLGII